MNYMKQIAQMLGVELGEKFNVEGEEFCLECDYSITEEGLVTYNLDDGMKITNIYGLDDLLTGEAKIIKKPWKPKNGEEYFHIGYYGHVLAITCDCGPLDAARIALGNCFRTCEEAEAHKDEILAKVREVLGE